MSVKHLILALAVLLIVAQAPEAAAENLLTQAVALAETSDAATESVEPAEPVPGDEELAEEAEAAEDAAEPDEIKISWKDGKTTLQLENAEVSLSNRFQFRFSHLTPDDEVQLPGTTEKGQGKGSFRIRRAKTTLEGWFWKPELTYELQLNWAEPEAGASTDKPLEDLYINWDASKKEAFQIRAGQFKVPLGRQEMATSIGLQFCDRSLLTFEFTRGRDRGIQLHGKLADTKIRWFTGVFNGNPASRTENENTKFQYNARVEFDPWGWVGKREGDVEWSASPRFSVGAQFENNNLYGATGGIGGSVSDLNTTIWGGDVVFKFKGLSLFGEYFHRERVPEEGDTFKSPGFNMQAGFFVIRERLELAFRYAAWDPSSLIDDNDRTEIGGAINCFLRGHNFKFQADYRELKDDARGHKTRVLRVQSYVRF